MKKILIPLFTLALIMASSCATKQLYDYKNYNTLSYNHIQTPNEKTLNDLFKLYDQMIENPKGTRKSPPPGVCADYGFLLIQKGEIEKGKKMLQMEIELYPESTVFVGRILKRFEE